MHERGEEKVNLLLLNNNNIIMLGYLLVVLWDHAQV